MPAFYLTFLAVLLSGIGARDQCTIAGLAQAQGRRPAVLFVAMAVGVVTAALAAWAAHWMLLHLPAPARAIFAAIGLAMAGLESLVIVRRRAPREPTNSLGALAVVLLAAQVTDAARFIVFALGVGLAAPIVSGAAGGLGAAVLAGFAWACPEAVTSPCARWVRRTAGGLLLLAATVTAFRQFGIL